MIMINDLSIKKIQITVSITEDTYRLFSILIGKNTMSEFVECILKKALAEKIESLRQAYKEAENDPDRKQLIKDWDFID